MALNPPVLSAVPPKLFVWLPSALQNSCSRQREQCVMQAVAKSVVCPEHVPGIGLKGLILKQPK